ncbi:hypothetical protein [Phascolarctobacterium faecium]|uniref:hypothetical protein n=1 Tax=Phascolarctobacterium faecium TaxID=33025 RepID=UPI0026670065|nr:hypothetical protein [Phascolarctobacterium faecium]MED9992731.1 hypothetical protein [Phascolarctobacterium faecium]
MKIGLVDVDGHRFPNLALMKISSWHKGAGDTVEWAGSLEHYDKVYMAKVFTFTNDDLQAYQTEKFIKGGTGYDLASKLPEDIERCYPDYELYGIKDMAYGYLTRGCPRQCPFCIVGQKEGTNSYKVADLPQFWSEQRYIKLLDPNIIACPDWENLLGQLADSGAWVDFTQGIDIRLMTDEKAAAINKVKYSMLHFAWDNPADMGTLEKLKEYRSVWKGSQRNRSVYVLTNFDSTHEEDLYRVYALRELGYDPYIMIYDKIHAPKETRYLQRWVNNKRIFRTIKYFKDYDHTRG